MKKKIIASILIAFVVIAAAIFGYTKYANNKSDSLAKKQVTNIQNSDFNAIYANLASDVQSKYKDPSDFAANFVQYGLLQEVSSIKLNSRTSYSGVYMYDYSLVRKDDASKGYRIMIKTTKGPVTFKVKDISIQEDTF